MATANANRLGPQGQALSDESDARSTDEALHPRDAAPDRRRGRRGSSSG